MWNITILKSAFALPILDDVCSLSSDNVISMCHWRYGRLHHTAAAAAAATAAAAAAATAAAADDDDDDDDDDEAVCV